MSAEPSFHHNLKPESTVYATAPNGYSTNQTRQSSQPSGFTLPPFRSFSGSVSQGQAPPLIGLAESIHGGGPVAPNNSSSLNLNFSYHQPSYKNGGDCSWPPVSNNASGSDSHLPASVLNGIHPTTDGHLGRSDDRAGPQASFDRAESTRRPPVVNSNFLNMSLSAVLPGTESFSGPSSNQQASTTASAPVFGPVPGVHPSRPELDTARGFTTSQPTNDGAASQSKPADVGTEPGHVIFETSRASGVLPLTTLPLTHGSSCPHGFAFPAPGPGVRVASPSSFGTASALPSESQAIDLGDRRSLVVSPMAR